MSHFFLGFCGGSKTTEKEKNTHSIEKSLGSMLATLSKGNWFIIPDMAFGKNIDICYMHIWTYKMVGRETKALSLCIGWLALRWVRIPHGSCIALYFPPGNVRCPSLCHWVVAGVRGKKLLCILAHSRSTCHLDRIGLFQDQLMHNQTDRGMRLHPKIEIM